MPHQFVQRLTRRTSVCLLAPMVIGSLALAARSVSAASAGGSRSHELYNHPLLSEAGTVAIESLRERGVVEPEDIVAQLTWGSAFEEAADGSFVEDSWFVEVVAGEADESVAPAREPEEPAVWVSPGVDRALAEADGKPVEMVFALRESWVRASTAPTAADALARDIVAGLVLTEADAELSREEFLLARAEEGLEAVADLADLIESCGGRVQWEDSSALLVAAEVEVSCIERVLAAPEVASVTASESGETDAGYSITVPGSKIDGIELEDLLQTTAFYNEGYYGSANLGYGEQFGFEVMQDNLGFRDGAGNLRIHPMECLIGLCWNTVNWDPGSGHTNGAISILAGDLTNGQDTGITDPDDQRAVSGVARGSEVWTGSTSVSPDIREIWVVQGNVRIAASSYSYNWSDPTCTGQDAYSVAWNDMFESGVAVFKSASNDGHTSTSDCLVGAPGSALGVFAVAASRVDGSAVDDPEHIDPKSSRGGTSSEGRGRTIIGATGPSRMSFAYPGYTWPDDGAGTECHYEPDWNGTGCDGEDFPSTSAATPAVAGAAELFREWFTTERSADMNNPGALYASMLLMGDRAAEGAVGLPPSAPLSTGYDGLWGAGQLRLRKFDPEGADNPFRYAQGNTCVGHGVTVTVPMNPNMVMPQDVGVLKATAWWYDQRHGAGVDNDEVTLKVMRDTTAMAEDNGTDNKARVVLDSVSPGYNYFLKIKGDDVTSDLEGCGSNSTRVFWAYYWEDSRRDDADDSSLARPE